MSYPFIQAFHDLGPARGPRAGFVVHMAEGGGTVGFLSRANRDGVSVHFVIEKSARIVQMLQLGHMHSSIRTTAIRVDEGPAPFGRKAAVDVLGKWADISHGTLGPNHATIACEIEGFAATGPNAAQLDSLAELADYLRGQYPGIRNLGHRDFDNYKPCPGPHIPWDRIGGHGAAGGDMQAPVTDETPKIITAGIVDWYDLDGKTIVSPKAGHSQGLAARQSPYGVGSKRAIYATVNNVRRLVLLTPATVAPLPLPVPDPAVTAAAVTAALDHVSTAVDGVDKAITEARPRP